MTASSASTSTPVAITELSEFTTLRVGGPAADVVVATTSEELRGAVSRADSAGRPVLLIGGGSNLLIGDEGFDGVVINGGDPRDRGALRRLLRRCGGEGGGG